MSLGSGWYYNSTSGSIIYQPALLGIPQAWFPDWHGPFPTKAAAQHYAATHGGAQPTGLGGNLTNTVTAGATTGLDDLAQRLTQSHTWQRVGEVVAGFILFYVGLRAFFPSVVPSASSVGRRAVTGGLF